MPLRTAGGSNPRLAPQARGPCGLSSPVPSHPAKQRSMRKWNRQTLLVSLAWMRGLGSTWPFLGGRLQKRTCISTLLEEALTCKTHGFAGPHPPAHKKAHTNTHTNPPTGTNKQRMTEQTRARTRTLAHARTHLHKPCGSPAAATPPYHASPPPSHSGPPSGVSAGSPSRARAPAPHSGTSAHPGKVGVRKRAWIEERSGKGGAMCVCGCVCVCVCACVRVCVCACVLAHHPEYLRTVPRELVRPHLILECLRTG